MLTNFCSREEHCEHDVLQKIRYYDLPEESIESILKYLLENNYINNARYTLAFVNDKLRFNKWGKLKIYYALSQKKIPSAIIQNSLATIDENEYLSILKKELHKKANCTSAPTEYEKKAKLYRFAASRGFEPDTVMKILENMGF